MAPRRLPEAGARLAQPRVPAVGAEQSVREGPAVRRLVVAHQGARALQTVRDGTTRERSFERSVERSIERWFERSSPLDPERREAAGERR
jgi:hypothetical protein